MTIGVLAFRELGKPDWLTLAVCISGGTVLYVLVLLALKEEALSGLIRLGSSLARKVGRL